MTETACVFCGTPPHPSCRYCGGHGGLEPRYAAAPYLKKAVTDATGVLVVSGSRHWPTGSEHLLKAFAVRACHIAMTRGFLLLVGDADGIDKTVIETAHWDYPVLHYCIMGCAAVGKLRNTFPTRDRHQPRSGIKRHGFTCLVPGGDTRDGSCFRYRDDAMLTELIQKQTGGFMGAWNGESKGVRRLATLAQKRAVGGLLYTATSDGDGWQVRERWGKV